MIIVKDEAKQVELQIGDVVKMCGDGYLITKEENKAGGYDIVIRNTNGHSHAGRYQNINEAHAFIKKNNGDIFSKDIYKLMLELK